MRIEELQELFALVEAKAIQYNQKEVEFSFPKKNCTKLHEYWEKNLRTICSYEVEGDRFDENDLCKLKF